MVVVGILRLLEDSHSPFGHGDQFVPSSTKEEGNGRPQWSAAGENSGQPNPWSDRISVRSGREPRGEKIRGERCRHMDSLSTKRLRSGSAGQWDLHTRDRHDAWTQDCAHEAERAQPAGWSEREAA